MENQPSRDLIQSPQQRPSDSTGNNALVREWVLRFAVNAGQTLTPEQANSIVALWCDAFADVSPNRLLAAFEACLCAHTFKAIPSVGDVRQHLTETEERAGNIEAEQKWQQVLDFIRLFYSPDLGIDRRAPRIAERTMAAIRAAGGMRWLHNCTIEELGWAKKRFVESYENWRRLGKHHLLLPAGPIKDAFAVIADAKVLDDTEPRCPLPTERTEQTEPTNQVDPKLAPLAGEELAEHNREMLAIRIKLGPHKHQRVTLEQLAEAEKLLGERETNADLILSAKRQIVALQEMGLLPREGEGTRTATGVTASPARQS